MVSAKLSQAKNTSGLAHDWVIIADFWLNLISGCHLHEVMVPPQSTRWYQEIICAYAVNTHPSNLQFLKNEMVDGYP